MKNENCDTCFKIICKSCGWEAATEEIILVQKEILRECPVCGWSPKDTKIASE